MISMMGESELYGTVFTLSKVPTDAHSEALITFFKRPMRLNYFINYILVNGLQKKNDLSLLYVSVPFQDDLIIKWWMDLRCRLPEVGTTRRIKMADIEGKASAVSVYIFLSLGEKKLYDRN